jgi:phage terminase small subunit
MKKDKVLTQKQQAFVDCYDGNGLDAARQAGYAGDDATLSEMSRHNLRIPCILQAIRARQLERIKGPIMTREERQELWTDIALNSERAKDRLAASKLLGKSECDFVQKTEIVYPDQIQYTEEEKIVLRELAVKKAREAIEEI